MTSDGVQIAYAVAGEGHGTPLLCLAAPFTNVRMAPPGIFAPILTAGEGPRASRPTAWLDFRGCGLSDRHVDNVSMGALERDVHAELAPIGAQIWAQDWSALSDDLRGFIADPDPSPERIAEVLPYFLFPRERLLEIIGQAGREPHVPGGGELVTLDSVCPPERR
jgi:hypothetical protein